MASWSTTAPDPTPRRKRSSATSSFASNTRPSPRRTAASTCAARRRCRSGTGIRVFDPKNPTRKPHLGSGGLFNNTPGAPGRDPLVLADKPFGEWNQFRIRQIGARTWVWLNDKLVVDGAVMENLLGPVQAAAGQRPHHAANARRGNPLAQPLRARDRRRGSEGDPGRGRSGSQGEALQGTHPACVVRQGARCRFFSRRQEVLRSARPRCWFPPSRTRK